MRVAGRALAASAAALLALIPPSSESALACGGGEEIVLESINHPDLPLTHFVGGRLGLLQKTFARSYLVVAFRYLSGVPLDPTEQSGALALWEDRLWLMDSSAIDPRSTPASAPTPSLSAPWERARTAVLGLPTTPVETRRTSATYVTIENCLADAFRSAAATVTDRAQRFGAASPDLRAWIAAQDVVFANCNADKPQIPTALPPSATALARADREYQIASAYFYASDFVEAERRFKLIAQDAASPWQPLARYLAVRSLTRRGTMAGDKPDLALLGRAQQEMKAVLADAGQKNLHPAATRYLSFLKVRLDPQGSERDLAVRLANVHLGADFHQALYDYTTLLDTEDAPLKPAAPDADRLSAWIGVVQGTTVASFERALRLYNGTQSPAWLVAALMTASNAEGARLDPLLAAAASVTADSPAYATVHFHRQRILQARGAGGALFPEITNARALLTRADGPSTRNAFTEQAMRAAPALDAFLANTFAEPAGAVGYETVAKPLEHPTPQFYPASAAALSSRVPLAELKAATRATVLPRPLRAHLAASTWVRAMLLGESTTAKDIAPVVSELNPKMKPYVDRVHAATTDPERKLGLITLILKMPSLGPDVDVWISGPATEEGIDSSYAGYFWCETPATTAASIPSFLSAAARQDAERERQARISLGGGPTYLANSAAALADQLPQDARVPEALHLAVRATRFGCKDAATKAASKRAFEVLHKKFPGSTWAKDTPYYY